MEKTYRDLDYNEVQDFANALGLNSETHENHREAAQLLFKVKEFCENKEDDLRREFDDLLNSDKDFNYDSNEFYAWVYDLHYPEKNN